MIQSKNPESNIQDQTPFHKVALSLLEDIRQGVMRGAGYETCGVELAERTSSGLNDTELRRLNLIDRRENMAHHFPTWSGETGLSSPGLDFKTFQGQKNRILPQGYEAKEQDDGGLEHQNRRKEPSSGL
jgi:hypothetical protein